MKPPTPVDLTGGIKNNPLQDDSVMALLYRAASIFSDCAGEQTKLVVLAVASGDPGLLVRRARQKVLEG